LVKPSENKLVILVGLFKLLFPAALDTT